jgi:ABC-type glycerol-3-phosphate transport system permease component
MKVLKFVLIGVVLFFIVFPLFMMTKYSISDRESIVTGGKYPEPFFPFKPTLEMFGVLFSSIQNSRGGDFALLSFVSETFP